MAADPIGLYGPDSVTWRVNREAVLLAGGGRALLLQVAHPLVAAGVEQHSNYDTDPWGRLFRTLDLTTKIVFGDSETAAEASQRLQARHRTVQGVAEDGRAYDARDPDLLLWVWATLVESSLLVYQRYVRPLSPPDLDRYYAEQTRFAVACGVPEGHWPEDFRAFMDYYDRTVADELIVGEAAHRVADSILHPDVPRPVKPIFEGLLNLMTVGLLPPVLRERYGLDWGPRRERLLATSTASIRRLLPLLPSLVRDFPAAQSASRRVKAAA